MLFLCFFFQMQKSGMDNYTGSVKVISNLTKNSKCGSKKTLFALALPVCDTDHCVQNKPQWKVRPAEGKRWERKGCKARVVTRPSISHEYLEHVRDAQSAKQMGNAIKTFLNVIQRWIIWLLTERFYFTLSLWKTEKNVAYVNCVRQHSYTVH